MCGITGIIRNNGATDKTELSAMNNALIHRGPDGEGFYIHENIGFGHRRLSIIDIETGMQPMSTADEKLWITYNGELYNFLQLKEELTSLGYSFRTKSDTEVILYAYHRWGADCLTRFRGMFAFAIADLDRKEVFIARDPFGIKPLVYRVTENYFAFSSELNALRKVNDSPPKGDLKALDLYLTLQYIPAPFTIYRDVYKLPPANFLRVNFNGKIIEQKKYYDLNFKAAKGICTDEWLAKTEETITSSVNAHLVSDVPFGVFLSGGIDSTLVAMKMAKILGKPVKAFTIGFEEAEYNELKYAETAAKKLGIELISEVVTENGLSILHNLINNHYGEPFGDSSCIPTWYVSRLARKEVTMALTGDGGDEMFAGYHSYNSWTKNTTADIVKRKIRLNQYMGIPRFLLGTLKGYVANKNSLNYVNEWIDLMSYSKRDLRRKLWRREFHSNINNSIDAFESAHKNALHYDRLSYAQYIDINTYLPYDILAKVDIAGMANSLETRPPLIDIEVAKIVQSLPLSEKRRLVENEKQGKYILKKLLLRDFPPDFVFRRKQGFAIPSDYWFFKDNSNIAFFKEIISGESSRLNYFFNKETIKELWDGYIANKGQFHYFGPLWLLFVFGIWLEGNRDIEFEHQAELLHETL